MCDLTKPSVRDGTLELEIVSLKNLEAAIALHGEIFSTESGALDFCVSIDANLVESLTGLRESADSVRYWLAKWGDKYIGMTGLYHYNKYPDDAWLGWYGIAKDFRGSGLGRQVFDWTCDLAKNEGFSNLRLFTSVQDNADAILAYRKFGMLEELYTAEKLPYECLIFSKSLKNGVVIPWSDRFLDLRNHENNFAKLDSHLCAEIVARFLTI